MLHLCTQTGNSYEGKLARQSESRNEAEESSQIPLRAWPSAIQTTVFAILHYPNRREWGSRREGGQTHGK